MRFGGVRLEWLTSAIWQCCDRGVLDVLENNSSTKQAVTIITTQRAEAKIAIYARIHCHNRTRRWSNINYVSTICVRANRCATGGIPKQSCVSHLVGNSTGEPWHLPTHRSHTLSDCACLRMNDVGKPCAGEPHARIDRGPLGRLTPIVGAADPGPVGWKMPP